ncbi:hypothetical protein [Pinibacter soli]|uniref:Uncharacterized protein n=1 Tax=Pinibacter soli TaxID=3044211 RepID=A0ABT6RAN3_9BACT|nr:hypothetical protein [Pinibacter soli]MDI3319461.1 hypothetical protein [Pinibacter soli]
MSTSTLQLDRKFLVSTFIIAFVYCCIIVFVYKIFGKEVAGIAGGILTAIVGVIFKQFETLQFKKNEAQNSSFVRYRFSWGKVIVVCFVYTGIFLTIQNLLETILPNLVGVSDDIGDVMRRPGGDNVFSDGSKIVLYYGYWELAYGSLAFFLGGFMAGKSLLKVTYMEAFVAGLFVFVLTYINSIAEVLSHYSNKSSLYNDTDQFTFSLVYIVFGLVGVYVSKIRSHL